MKDEIVGFEVARLAKEKGFSVQVYDLYKEDKSKNDKVFLSTGIEYDSDRDCLWDWNLNGGESGESPKIIPYPNDDINYNYYSAPTQSLLQRWLREVHGLHITIFSKSQESWMFRVTKPGQDLEDGLYGEDGDSYEDILEYALEEALNLINK